MRNSHTPLGLSVGLVLALWATGCVTPSVPIPPPEPERMSFAVDADDDVASFTYRATPTYADAVVYVFNRDEGRGIITTAAADGSVGPTQPFPAIAGDRILVTFEVVDQIAATCVTLRDGQSSSAFECDQ